MGDLFSYRALACQKERERGFSKKREGNRQGFLLTSKGVALMPMTDHTRNPGRETGVSSRASSLGREKEKKGRLY